MREPFPVSSHGVAGTTPLRSPRALLLTGLALGLLGVGLVVWAVAAYAAGTSGMQLWQLIGMSLLLLVIPVPLLWIGLARVLWQRRYRRFTGSDPVLYRD